MQCAGGKTARRTRGVRQNAGAAIDAFITHISQHKWMWCVVRKILVHAEQPMSEPSGSLTRWTAEAVVMGVCIDAPPARSAEHARYFLICEAWGRLAAPARTQCSHLARCLVLGRQGKQPVRPRVCGREPSGNPARSLARPSTWQLLLRWWRPNNICWGWLNCADCWHTHENEMMTRAASPRLRACLGGDRMCFAAVASDARRLWPTSVSDQHQHDRAIKWWRRRARWASAGSAAACPVACKLKMRRIERTSLLPSRPPNVG